MVITFGRGRELPFVVYPKVARRLVHDLDMDERVYSTPRRESQAMDTRPLAEQGIWVKGMDKRGYLGTENPVG
jgi:hypothetical protein